MPFDLRNTLKTLDLRTLESLAGLTIVRAVSAAYDVNRAGALAQLILDKYGVTLLAQREVRNSIIDGISTEKAKEFAAALKLSAVNANPHVALQQYFSSFNRAKAIEFVEFFGIDEAYIPSVVDDKRTECEEIAGSYGASVKLRGVLHPYQKRVKDQVRINLDNGIQRQMVQMPTGSGKTATALEVVVDMLRQPRFDGLLTWVVDSNELAEQAMQTFVELWAVRGDAPTLVYRYFGAFEPSFDAHRPGVVFAGFPKLTSQRGSSDVRARNRYLSLRERTRLLIVDEAHASVAETYEPVVRSLGEHAQLVGLSATPGRGDDESHEDLGRLFDQRLVSITGDHGEEVHDAIEYLRKGRYLSHLELKDLPGSTSSESNEARLCAQLAQDAARNAHIVEQIALAVQQADPTIVFACTKDHVFALVALCRARQIDVGFIVGETPSAQREEMLDRFRSGKLLVLINHEILSTGVDLPNLRRLIITRPVGSAILYSQIIGRALRGPLNGGSAKNTIVNVRDNLNNFPTASSVYEHFKRQFRA